MSRLIPLALPLVAVMAAGPNCSFGEGDPPPLEPPVALEPCTTDEDCLALPGLDRLGPSSFPPTCINAMCQVVTSHRCTTDADCADVRNGDRPSRCVEWPNADRTKFCETWWASEPDLMGAPWLSGWQCTWCCYSSASTRSSPQNWYSCDGLVCAPLPRSEAPRRCEAPPWETGGTWSCSIAAAHRGPGRGTAVAFGVLLAVLAGRRRRRIAGASGFRCTCVPTRRSTRRG